MYKCLICDKRIPFRKIYLYAFLGPDLVCVQCDSCGNELILKKHRISIGIYIFFMLFILLYVSYYLEYGLLVGFLCFAIAFILIAPIYFKILLSLEKKYRVS